MNQDKILRLILWGISYLFSISFFCSIIMKVYVESGLSVRVQVNNLTVDLIFYLLDLPLELVYFFID